jgi:hypothetical protein
LRDATYVYRGQLDIRKHFGPILKYQLAPKISREHFCPIGFYFST